MASKTTSTPIVIRETNYDGEDDDDDGGGGDDDHDDDRVYDFLEILK